MATRSDIKFFIWDTADGKVGVATTMPAGGVVEGPLQSLRVVGPGQIPMPKSPMTAAEFTAWREGLEEAGFQLEMRTT